MYVTDWIERDVKNNSNFVKIPSPIGQNISSKNGLVAVIIYGDDNICIVVEGETLDKLFNEVKDFGYNSDFNITWISDRVVDYLNYISSLEE